MKGCEDVGNWTLAPGHALTLRPYAQCGLPFPINFKDTVNVYDPNDQLVASISWDNVTQVGGACLSSRTCIVP